MLLLLVSIVWRYWLLGCQPRWGNNLGLLDLRTSRCVYVNETEYLYFFSCRFGLTFTTQGSYRLLPIQCPAWITWLGIHHPPAPFFFNYLPNLFITCHKNFLPVWNLCIWPLSLTSESCYSCKKPSCSLHSAEGMNAGGYGNLLMSIEQPQGEYSVTISFLNLITTLVRVSVSGMLCVSSTCRLLR